MGASKLKSYSLIIFVFCCCSDNRNKIPAIEKHENGQFSIQGTYVDNLEEGVWSFWYENGKLEKKGIFKEGKKDGEWNYWYEDGSLKKTENYKDGKLNGYYLEISELGNKTVEGSYNKGEKFGEWMFWNKNGVLTSISNFKNDYLDGMVKLFYPNSLVAGQGMYEEGNLKGDWIGFYSNGLKSIQIRIEKGKQYYLNIWDSLGNHQVKDGFGKFNYILPYGNLSISGEVSNKVPVGKWYHITGTDTTMVDSLIYTIPLVN
ncbi:MAG: toxin-antitoxin system YwqK family antitoxin [Bacteroidota bacterium]